MLIFGGCLGDSPDAQPRGKNSGGVASAEALEPGIRGGDPIGEGGAVEVIGFNLGCGWWVEGSNGRDRRHDLLLFPCLIAT